MSRINTRNYQLGLAFNDGDLRKPKHDEIMHWLSAWVQNVENVRAMYETKEIRRRASKPHRIAASSHSALKSLKEYERENVLTSFRTRFSRQDWEVREPWQNEPERLMTFQKLEWEVPLRDGRGGLVGFCDLAAEYSATATLEKAMITLYSATPPDGPRYSSSWKFDEIEKKEEWLQHAGTMKLFFEVKTEIPSVGELMRQLQLYRGTDTIKASWSHLVVVAPPNNEAAAVCQAHGISFVQYRP